MSTRDINPWDLAAPLYRLALSFTYPGYSQLYRLIRAHLAPTMNVLEIGCGPGNITRQVADACGTVTATDAAANMIKQARRYNPRPNVEYRQADAFALPFAEGEFDAVYTVNMLHIVPEPERVLDQLARVITKNGRLIAATFTRDHTLRAKMATRLAPVVGHDQFFAWTDETYRQFFTDAGWSVRRHTTVRSLFQISIVVATPPQL